MRIFSFGAFELDERLYELRRDGARVAMQPRVFDVLLSLVAHRDRVLGKHELLAEHWPEHVSESVLPRCIAAARRALGDDADGARFIQTIHARGYRFVAAVEERSESSASAAEAVAAQGAAESPGDTRHAYGPPFVGRERALADLDRALHEALAGAGRLALIVGEPGIGKTRMARELAARARACGVTVLFGRCAESQAAPAYWPWLEVLRGAGRAARQDSRGNGGPGAVPAVDPGLLAEALEAQPIPALHAGAAEQARFRLCERVASALIAIEPLLIVIDDLHWADPPSLDVLVHLARRMAGARLLLLATLREEGPLRGTPLGDALAALAREPGTRRVALAGLDPPQVAALVAAVAGEPAPAGVVAVLHERARGNPFFVEQLVRLLASAGTLGDASAAARALPDGVRDAIGRRIDGLGAAAARVLAAGAVLGELRPDVLEAVTGTPRAEVLDVLDRAAAARVLEPVVGAPGRHVFAHALVREALHDSLGGVERGALHAAIGRLLESFYREDPAPHAAELARHFFAAAAGGCADEAVRWCALAGDHALAVLGYEQAAEHYARALAACDLVVPRPEARRAELSIALGHACTMIGGAARTRASEAFHAAAELAGRLGRADLLARAALGLGGAFDYFGTPRDDELRALLEAARDALGADGDPGLRAGVLSRLAGLPPWSESLQARARASLEAVALARRAADPGMLARALGARYWALLGPDHIEERLAICDELAALDDARGTRGLAVLSHEYRFACRLLRADVAGADAEIAALEARSRAMRHPDAAWLVRWFRASRAISDGRFDDAERLAGEGSELAGRARHPAAEAIFGGVRLWVAHERGDLATFEAALRLFSGQYPWAALVRRVGAAHARAELGDEREARRLLDEVGDVAALPRDEHWLALATLLAAACARLGDRERAAVLLRELAPFAPLLAVHDLLRVEAGPVALSLGVLCATLGRDAEASAHFAAALETSERIGALPAVARTCLEWASLLRRSRGAADRARVLAARAARIAGEIGARTTLARARALAG